MGRAGSLALLATALTLAFPRLAPAEEPTSHGRRVTVGITGGFQLWALSDLEDGLRLRNAELATESYDMGDPAYDLALAYGLDLRARLGRSWFARAQLDWTRMSFDDRDRRFLQFLGGRERTPVSLSYETRIETRPLLGSLGAGRSWDLGSIALSASGGFVIAPLKVVDEIGAYLENVDTVSEVQSTGVGFGGEIAGALDYFTDVNMNLFVEIFARAGRTDVELTDDVWDSTLLPQRRSVDLNGGGIRLGFRWI